MKIKLTVLFLAISGSLLFSGCVVSAGQRMMGTFVGVPAKIQMFNNIPDTIAVLHSMRSGELEYAAVASGVPVAVGVCGFPQGGTILTTVLLYDKAKFNPNAREASYLGSSQTIPIYMNFDGSGRFGASIQVTGYDTYSKRVQIEYTQQ